MSESRLDDNTVRYSLYPDLTTVQQESLSMLCDQYMDNLSIYLSSYYWYYMDFNLKVINQPICHSDLPHIEGVTNFDENIEDEWFIVYLLLKLSFIDQNLIIKMEDSDGEFLLIETADYLPKWIKPDNSINRCFIYKGKIHLIDQNNELFLNKTLSLSEALCYLRKNFEKTVCNENVQSQIYKRVKKFDFKDKLLHKCKARLPFSIAKILYKDPLIISQVVRAFYNRDSLDIANCRLMKNFQPDQMCDRIVTMSRFNYAQLINQKINPDKASNWKKINSDLPNYQIYDLGFKISSGFEILLSKKSNTNHFNKFLNILKKNGDFDGLLKGSLEYNEKLNLARKNFSEINNKNDIYENSEISEKINLYLKDEFLNLEFLKEKDKNLEKEDSDEWLSQIPDYLIENSSIINSNENDLTSEIPKSFKEFINDQSNFKGVKVKKKSKLKENAFKMISNNLRSIITMDIYNSNTSSSESSLSDYDSDSDLIDKDIQNPEINFSLKLNVNDESENKSSKKKNYRKKISLKEYMHQMDDELSKTEIGKSFVCTSVGKAPIAELDEIPDEINNSNDQTNQIIDYEVNAVKNILESLKSQEGLSGPSSNILGSMGIYLPQNSDK